ncbi:LysE/ArgO family amino acid transporter [Paracoccus sp. (in: a-proteobacteria)]|uniref:LysE/ArgO family amino acid transporter n=1 Tax=Paracoccus sp. TaxID=267 RepID=UPI003A865E35
MTAYLVGFGTGLSLIVAIGAQNAFVLKQGLMRQHVLAVCLFCALSDSVLIALGVSGMAVAGARATWLIEALRWGGVAFLLAYGARAFRAAWAGGAALRPEGRAAGLAVTLASIAALTWLNPHVWLDTVVLLGAISAQWPNRTGFATGAISASFLFFFALGYGARLLVPVFAKPRAWQILDVAIGCIMWAIAAKLVIG